MKRKRLLWRIAGTFILAMILAAICIEAYIEPQSAVGYRFFRVRYDFTNDKKSLLRWYNGVLIAHSGGYIPEQTDRFLCAQLQNPTTPAEFEAIVDFYVAKAGGREGNFVFLLPGEVKQRISGSILSRIEGYTPSEAADAFILVEGLRQGDDLGKAAFLSPHFPSNYQAWWQQDGLPEAKKRFKNWWQTDSSWDEKVKHDPLAGSGLRIEAP